MSRRAAGDGSLYFREDKQLWVAQHHGVYRYSKDKDKARAKLNELLTKSEDTKPQNITVSTLLDQWLEFASPNLKPSSIKRYKETIRIYVKPALGSYKLSSLTAYQVQQQYSKWLNQGISPNTVYRCHTVLSGAFKRAAKWQLIRSNIIKDVDAPKLPHKEIEVFDQWEVQAILSASKYERLEAAFVLALSTGARAGEILSLEPHDYDAAEGTLAIRRTLVNNGTQIGTPKSKNSRRTIQLPEIARDALGRTDLNGKWMFPSKADTNLFYHNFLRFHWKPLCAKAGVTYRNFHVCRHYVASELLRRTPLSATARYLGDTEMTILRTYSHLLNGMEALAPAAMDEALG
jgi:integrase